MNKIARPFGTFSILYCQTSIRSVSNAIVTVVLFIAQKLDLPTHLYVSKRQVSPRRNASQSPLLPKTQLQIDVTTLYYFVIALESDLDERCGNVMMDSSAAMDLGAEVLLGHLALLGSDREELQTLDTIR